MNTKHEVLRVGDTVLYREFWDKTRPERQGTVAGIYEPRLDRWVNAIRWSRVREHWEPAAGEDSVLIALDGRLDASLCSLRPVTEPQGSGVKQSEGEKE